MKEAIKDAQEAITSQPPGRFEIVEKPDGSEHWHWFDGEGDDHGGALLPPVYRKVMDDRALDIAELDPKLFKQFEEAVTAVAELSHLRGSLVNYANTDDDIEAHFFEGFTEWALEQFDDIEAELGKLYWACTGNELTKPRLR